MPDLITIIAAHIEHPDQKRLADDPATSLRAIRLQHDALICLALDIEDTLGIELADEAIHAWHSVGCIQETVRKAIRSRAMGGLVAADADLVGVV